MEQSSDDRIGPYRVTGLLADGAMAAIYRAVDPATGAAVAIKTTKVSDPADVESLRREAHALQRLHHPGVVGVLGTGVQAGMPWYAMELLSGGTLADKWEGEERSDVVGSVAILQRLCAPLAFLHGEGLVHRDLKPLNIGFRSDGSPVLMDLGLAGRFGAEVGREELEAGGAVIGTLHYMAPEQARGEYVDARADLYSLGCLLYKALTGVPPFEGAAWEVLNQHLETTPIPPSQRAKVPDSLDSLILRLLAKNPRDRIGFAEDVAAALAPFTGVASDSGGGRPYLYRPSFAGRDMALSQLRGALAEVSAGVGRCVMLAGESGVGKTRLAMELTRQASAGPFHVVTGECEPLLVSAESGEVLAAPLQPLAPLLRGIADRCRQEGVGATERLLGRRAKVLVAYEPSLAAIPGFADQPDPVPLPPQAARARVLSDLTESVGILAGESPLLLVLDDLQWSDELTLSFLSYLQRLLPRLPIMVVGTYRTEEGRDSLRELAQGANVSIIEIGRLSTDAIGAMVGDILGLRSTPDHLVDFLVRASEGNPFFVAEYLRAAVAAGFLHRSDAGDWEMSIAGATLPTRYEALPLPRSIRELIYRRLDDLSVPAVGLLEAGAVLGREFSYRLAGDLTGIGEDARLDGLHELRTRQVVDVSDRDSVRFAHDKLREAAYERLPDDRRAYLHGRAAALLEERHAADADFPRIYATLAQHWFAAGERENGLRYLSRAGEYALATGAHSDAHRLLKQALDVDDQLGGHTDRFERARWHRMLGVAAFGVAELATSIAHSGAALVSMGERVPHSTTGWVWVLLSELPEQIARILMPRLVRPRVGLIDEKLHEVAAASDQLATSFYYAADPLPAVANLVRGVNRAGRVGSTAAASESNARLGFIAGAAGLQRTSRAYFRRARGDARGAGADAHRAAALYMEAMHHMGQCRWGLCEQRATESVAVFERIGDGHEAATALAIGASGVFYEGRIIDALGWVRRLDESARARGNALHEAWGSFLMARSELARGSADGIAVILEEVRAGLLPLPETLSIAMCEGTLAWAWLLEGEFARAVEIAEALLERLCDNNPWVPQCMDGYESCAEVLLFEWHRTGSRGGNLGIVRSAQLACRELRSFARRFPLAVPAALRCSGWERVLLGRPRAGARAWVHSVRSAHEHGMRLEEARTRLLAARALPDAGERAQQRVIATEIFAELGCQSLEQRLNALP